MDPIYLSYCEINLKEKVIIVLNTSFGLLISEKKIVIYSLNYLSCLKINTSKRQI